MAADTLGHLLAWHVTAADAQDRDLNEEERKEFTEAMDQADALEADITRIQGERNRLRAAAERKFVHNEPEKPGDSKADARMKRADFNKLDTGAQAAFIKAGGKVED